MPDPYVDPSSGCLRNKLGITQQVALDLAERDITSARLAELEVDPVDGGFDFAHLKEIHRRLFADLYDWAGEARKVNTGKGDSMFCPWDKIDAMAKRVPPDRRASPS